MASPDKRRPAVGATGLLKSGTVGTNSDFQDSATAYFLQVNLVRERFGVSWPMARVIAELVYEEARR